MSNGFLGEYVGSHGIRAKVLAYSISAITGLPFITFEIEYPRIILAELNTHRMLSKNSASSRAIPFAKMQEQLYGRPMRFGQANPGMQDKGEDYNGVVTIPAHLWTAFDEFLYWEHQGPTIADFTSEDESGEHVLVTAEVAWEFAGFLNTQMSGQFHKAGYHKQVYNRLTEARQIMKTVISGTEWANFFWLRHHDAADPSLEHLAHCMWMAMQASQPTTLQPGEWHLPYVDTVRGADGKLYYGEQSGFVGRIQPWYELEDAIKISCARSAAVSFRNSDYGLAKSLEVYGRLVGDERKHASAFEHCATPMARAEMTYPDFVEWKWEPGVSHMDIEGNLWSGNLKGFIQYRKLIPGENYTGSY